MPRLIEEPTCPHCGAKLPSPKPRSCPECAGSLQQRYLRAGCLSSAPKLVGFGLVLGWAVREIARVV